MARRVEYLSECSGRPRHGDWEVENLLHFRRIGRINGILFSHAKPVAQLRARESADGAARRRHSASMASRISAGFAYEIAPTPSRRATAAAAGADALASHGTTHSRSGQQRRRPRA